MSEDAYECIGLCEIEPESGICLGCGRPLGEDSAAATTGSATAATAGEPASDQVSNQAGNKVRTSSAQ